MGEACTRQAGYPPEHARGLLAMWLVCACGCTLPLWIVFVRIGDTQSMHGMFRPDEHMGDMHAMLCYAMLQDTTVSMRYVCVRGIGCDARMLQPIVNTS